MATGGDYDPTTTTEKTPLITRDDDDDDDDDMSNTGINTPITEEKRWEFPKDTNPNTTQPFKPSASSTPASGEQIAMATRLPKEQQGASGGIAETSFMGDLEDRVKAAARREVGGEFPNVDNFQLDFRYTRAPKSGGAIVEVKYHTSEKWYTMFTKGKGASEKTLNKSLPKQIKTALGKSLTDEFNETNVVLKDLQKQEATQSNALQQAEQRAADAQQLRRDIDAIQDRIAQMVVQIQELEETHGPLDKDAIQRLKDQKRAAEVEHQAKRKEYDKAVKAEKQVHQLQQDINKIQLAKGETERRRGQLRAQKDAIQPLDEIKNRYNELDQKNGEDLKIIEDEKTPSTEREAAQDRLEERREEMERLHAEIEARERQRPLRERIREIFKKYGWTLQAVVLAAGITISAVVMATLNGLAKATKAIGNGLKTLGKQAANALPGLIGSIVSFIFKAAGSVISFLGEHAWLLILAVVAYMVERVTKRSRS